MMPSVFAGIDLRAASSNPVPGSLTTAGSLTGEESAVEASFAAMIAGALRAATPVPVAGDPEPVLAVPGGTAPPTVGMFPSPAQELPVPERPGISVPGEPMVRGGGAWSPHADRAAAPALAESAQPTSPLAVGARMDSKPSRTSVIAPWATLPDGAGAAVAVVPVTGQDVVTDGAEGAEGDPKPTTDAAETTDPRWPTPVIPLTVSQGDPDRSSPPPGLPDRSRNGARRDDDSLTASMPSGPFGRAMARGPITPGADEAEFSADRSEVETARSRLRRGPGESEAIPADERVASPGDQVPSASLLPALDPATMAVISAVGCAPSKTPITQDESSLPGERPIAAGSPSAGHRPGVPGPDSGTFSRPVPFSPPAEPSLRSQAERPFSSARESSGEAQEHSSRSQRRGIGSQDVSAGMDSVASSLGRHRLDPIPDPVAPPPAGASEATDISQDSGVGTRSIDPATMPVAWLRGGRPSGPPDASSDVLIGDPTASIPPTRSAPDDPKMREPRGVSTPGNTSPTAPLVAGFAVEPSAGLEVLELAGGAPPVKSPRIAVIQAQPSESVAVPATARSLELVSPSEHASTISPTSQADALRTAAAVSLTVASAVRASASGLEYVQGAWDRRQIPAVGPEASMAAPAVSPFEPSPSLSHPGLRPTQRLGLEDSPSRIPGSAHGGWKAGRPAGSSEGGPSEDSMGRSGATSDVPVVHDATVVEASEVEPPRDRILRGPRVEVSGPAWVSRSEDPVWDPHLVSRSGPIHGPSIDFPGSEAVMTSGAVSSGGEPMSAHRVPSGDPTGMAHLRVPVSTSPGGDQNTARETDLPAEWSANLARIAPPPEDVAIPAAKTEGPGFRASGGEENPAKQGFPPVVPPPNDDASGRGSRSGDRAGTPSASRASAMDSTRPMALATAHASEQSGGAVPADPARPDASGGVMTSRLHETASASLLQVVRPVEPESATPAPEPPGTRSATQRLQELLTGEAVLFQRLRNGSMTAVLRPEPGSELRVELRRRQGAVEIRATVERGDARAMAEGWAELQHQLRGQGILLHPLERESSPSAQRGIPDASGDRSSNAGGRGRQQGSAQNPSAWSDGPPPSGSTSGSPRPGGARTPASPRGSSRRLLESWA